jgi:hypothetical protein
VISTTGCQCTGKVVMPSWMGYVKSMMRMWMMQT